MLFGRPVAMVLGAGLLVSCAADFTLAETPQSTTTSRVSHYRPEAASPKQPLNAVLEYARREQEYTNRMVRDFTCRLVKRERINGVLQEMHFIDMEVREAQADSGQPLSIYLHFLGPKNVLDRRVIFVEGANQGKMMVRNGGKHFDYVIAEVDPNSDAAREETLVPVSGIGFNRLLAHMIDVLEKHRQIDPTGENTTAERIRGAKINGRECTVIRITHPQPMPGLEFHQANVFVDDQLHAPVRVDYSDWPKLAGRPAPLIAEYTYTNLQLNVDLPDSAFSTSRLRGN
jgi:hypothetical protein